MRRPALIFLLAAVALGGCGDFCLAMLGTECVDTCYPGERQCSGHHVEECSVEPWWSSCYYMYEREDCSVRRAVCVYPARCECPGGLADCRICADLATDPNNCGGCDIRCTGVCVNGVCSP